MQTGLRIKHLLHTHMQRPHDRFRFTINHLKQYPRRTFRMTDTLPYLRASILAVLPSRFVSARVKFVCSFLANIANSWATIITRPTLIAGNRRRRFPRDVWLHLFFSNFVLILASFVAHLRTFCNQFVHLAIQRV